MDKDINSLIRPGMGMKVVKSSEYDWDEWNGRLLMYEPAQAGETYALGIDPAEGVGADRSVCEVIKVGTMAHADVQVAEFACDFLDPIDFASIVNTIGHFYADSDGTEAFATIECNAPCGDTMINDLRSRLDYTNLYVRKAYDKLNNVYTNTLGWWTNRNTRPKIIARGLHAFANGDIHLNSPFLLDEMSDFERDHFIAKAKARHGRHDDRLMALLIGYWGAHDDEWMAGEDMAEERRLRGFAITEQAKRVEMSGRKPDYQNSALSYSQMMARADDALLDD